MSSLMRMAVLTAGLMLGVARLAEASDTAGSAPVAMPTHQHDFDIVARKLELLRMYRTLGDIAIIDEVRFASVPGRIDNPTGLGAGNPLVIPAYTFVPKRLGSQKAPLIVYVHGGLHAHFGSASLDVTRDLLEHGYVVIAPDYRGSTGYGREFYDEIDYGGAEIDDSRAARDWAVAHLPNVDGSRVGIIGTSHGGYHALMNLFRWPDAYQVAYAGVPVSDLVLRMAYQGDSYHQTFADFIGKRASENLEEYRRRSPVYYADKLRTPLLIHTTSNDADVHVMEVQHLIAALKAAGKQFSYRIYDDAPGGHAFFTMNSAVGAQARQEVYEVLARHLRPAGSIKGNAE